MPNKVRKVIINSNGDEIPDAVDDDLVEDEAPTADTTAGDVAAPQAAPEEEERPDETADDDAATAKRLREQMNALTPQIKAALEAQPGRKAELLKMVQDFQDQTSLTNANRSFEEAERTLGAIRTLLAAEPEDEKAAVYAECRDIYAKARAKIQASLGQLEKAVGGVCTLEQGYDPGAAADRAGTIYEILDTLDERLLRTLDKAAATKAPDQRDRLQREAIDLVDEYLAYATGDPFVTAVDDNGFLAVGVRKTAVDALTAIARKL
jgi:hypothetical protein